MKKTLRILIDKIKDTGSGDFCFVYFTVLPYLAGSNLSGPRVD